MWFTNSEKTRSLALENLEARRLMAGSIGVWGGVMRIHGTNDTRKIGRRSSNGCIGLYNEQIAELFELATVGTQVKLI